MNVVRRKQWSSIHTVRVFIVVFVNIILICLFFSISVPSISTLPQNLSSCFDFVPGFDLSIPCLVGTSQHGTPVIPVVLRCILQLRKERIRRVNVKVWRCSEPDTRAWSIWCGGHGWGEHSGKRAYHTECSSATKNNGRRLTESVIENTNKVGTIYVTSLSGLIRIVIGVNYFTSKITHVGSIVQ